MKRVSLKYLIRNKKNHSFYAVLFIISILSIFIVLSNDLYYFKTYTQKLENSYVLVTVSENDKKILNNNDIHFEECEQYLDTDSDRCKIYISIAEEDMISELDHLGINYVVYSEFFDAINAKKIGNIIKVLTIIVAIGLIILFIPMIKLKLNKEIIIKRNLSYLGYNNKDIIFFDLVPIMILIPIYIIISCFIFILFLNSFNIISFLKNNIINVICTIIIVNILLCLEYFIMLIISDKKVK